MEANELQKLLDAADASPEKTKTNDSEDNLLKDLVQQDNYTKELLKTDSFEKLTKEIFGTADDIDSSDDEGTKKFLERKYNEYGEDVNLKIKQQQQEWKEKRIAREVNTSLNGKFRKENNSNNSLSFNFKKKSFDQSSTSKDSSEISNKFSSTVYTDPVFGMRIVNPLISNSILKDRMGGKKAVGMSSIAFHVQRGDLNQDWVIAGAIVSKSPIKTAKNGSLFSIWKISDLKGEIKTVSLFLFQNAHKELWKTAVGTVVAVLNPRVLDNKQKYDAACLSIESAQKIMIIGQSKDLGFCKAKKKNGDTCNVTVNNGDSEYCIFHMQQEYKNMSKRSELQSATSGRGLDALRNKVLGKSEVFYGGQSFTAIPARKNYKQEAKDKQRLMTLSECLRKSQTKSENSNNSIQKGLFRKEIPYEAPSGPKSKLAASFDATPQQRLKDLERLKALNCGSVEQGEVNSVNNSSQIKTNQSLVPEKLRKDSSFSLKTPTLSKDSFTIELNVSNKKAELAKVKALNIIKQKPIEKVDPNFVKYRGTTEGKKRLIDIIDQSASEAKRQKLEEEEISRKTRIQRIMEATSSHIDLLKMKDNEQQEKYFNKMEKKEMLEEKMLKTFKVPCKAVICLKCKYTAFSAADRCKDEKHPFKVIDTEKRFFQCQDCSNRTVTVHKIPKLSCKNCQSSKWERAPMIREKKTDASAKLSIRGDEEKFLGTLNSSVSLNLLVPE